MCCEYTKCVNACVHQHTRAQRVLPFCCKKAKKIIKTSHVNTYTQNKSLCAAAATHLDSWDSAFPLYWAAWIRALVCSFPCLLMLTLGFRAARAHKHIRTCPTVTHQYLWGFLLAVVPAWAWLLGSVCLVLNWLHKLHQRRGFTLNGIFGLFIGWTLQAESYLMRHVSKRQRGLRLILGAPECVRVCFFNQRTYVFAWVHG